MKITMPMTITAADSQNRIVSGRIVTWNEQGNTSAGKTVFKPNSIALGKNVKLLWEHRLERPLGKLMSAEITDSGIDAQFKIAGTIAGDDYLTEAAEGLRDGLSVGVKIDSWTNNDGVMTIDAAKLIEVSAVTEPAIDSARVSEVAASEAEPNENSEPASADSDQPTEGEQVSDTTVPAPAEETVEAAKAVAPAVTAAFYAKPRVNLNATAGQYALAQIRAAQGDTDSRDLVAALDAATTTENIGVVPPTYLRDVIGIIDASMPFADSLEQGTLPATGMKFYRPVLGNQATTAQTAEAVELDSTDTTITSLEIDVVKIGGANKISVELLERSDPAYLDVLLRELAASWAQKADAYAFSIACGNGIGSSSGSTLYGAIADGIADSYGVVRKTPNRFLADTGNFAELLAAVDDNKRPLFAAAAPQNAAGLMTQGSTNGTIAGLTLVVDPNIDTGTGVKGVVYPSDAATFYKSAAFQIRSNVVSTAEVEVGIYGYVACARKYATAFRNLTVA